MSLRDGKRLFGVLRTFDQYANLVLQNTIERIYLQSSYGEVNRGLYIVRGENVAWVGEIDPDKEDSIKEELKLEKVEYSEVEKQLAELVQAKKKLEKVRSKRLAHNFGILTEPFQDNMY